MEILTLGYVKSLLIILTAAVFSMYTIYWQKRKPDLESWSKSYYELKFRPLFQIWILSLSILIILIGLNWWWVAFGSLLTLVAFFPTIRNKKHFRYHLTGAVLSLGGAYIYILIVSDFSWVYITTGIVIALIWVFIIKHGETLKNIMDTSIKTAESIVFIEVIFYFILELL